MPKAGRDIVVLVPPELPAGADDETRLRSMNLTDPTTPISGATNTPGAPAVATTTSAATPSQRGDTPMWVILGALDALRNGAALFTLLGTFAAAGLLLASAEVSLGRGTALWGAVQAALAAFVAFYGVSATGLQLMDQARGVPVRNTQAAGHDALLLGHRLLLVLIIAAAVPLALIAAAAGLVWLARPDVLGIVPGAALFGVAVPATVVAVGVALVALAAVVAPLAGPAVWSGLSLAQALRWLLALLHRRLLLAALLLAAVALVASAVAALSAAVVMAGAKVLTLLAVFVGGLDIPPQQLMAGLFGYGLRSMGAAGAPAAQSAHGAAALIGGGVVFAVALVLPALVTLRGACAVVLVLGIDDRGAPPTVAPAAAPGTINDR